MTVADEVWFTNEEIKDIEDYILKGNTIKCNRCGKKNQWRFTRAGDSYAATITCEVCSRNMARGVLRVVNSPDDEKHVVQAGITDGSEKVFEETHLDEHLKEADWDTWKGVDRDLIEEERHNLDEDELARLSACNVRGKEEYVILENCKCSNCGSKSASLVATAGFVVVNCDECDTPYYKYVVPFSTAKNVDEEIESQTFYAVAKGRKIGVFKDWDWEVKPLVKGFKNAKYEKFKSLREAWDFVDKYTADL